jgi:tRNA threonylcarbamoyladenosine biosynthesis protein TsaE
MPITTSPQETKKLAKKMASGFCGGEILCLSGDLGVGKTTFTQGLLEALGAEGPYTSPTFNIIKEYRLTTNNLPLTTNAVLKHKNKLSVASCKLSVIYHIDAYRIKAADLRDLGFLDFAGKPGTITIIEWPENVTDIIPNSSIWIDFKWLDENQRKITLHKK